MEVLGSALTGFGLGAVLCALVCAHLSWLRSRDLRALRRVMEAVRGLDLSKRVSPKVEQRLGLELNAMLDAVSLHYQIAERRGLEWEKAVDAIDEMVCVLDSKGRIVRTNHAFAERLDADVRLLRGLELDVVLAGAGDESAPIAVARKSRGPTTAVVGPCALGRRLRVKTAEARRPYGEAMTVAVVTDLAAQVRSPSPPRMTAAEPVATPAAPAAQEAA